MTRPQQNTLLACGTAAALLSVPLPWMTVTQSTGELFESIGAPPGFGDGPGFGGGFGGPFGGGTVTADVSGLSGTISFPVRTPLWLVALTAAAACVVPLLTNTRTFAAPRWLPWTLAGVAAAWVAAVLAVVLTDGRADLGVGTLLAAASVAAAFAALLLPASDPAAGDPAHHHRRP